MKYSSEMQTSSPTQSPPAVGPESRARCIPNLRWWIGGLLFASTVINYIDRQTLALLAPYLKIDYHWTNSDYANLLISFRIAYSIGQTVCSRFINRIGTKRGLSLSVFWYSIVAISFLFISFLLVKRTVRAPW